MRASSPNCSSRRTGLIEGLFAELFVSPNSAQAPRSRCSKSVQYIEPANLLHSRQLTPGPLPARGSLPLRFFPYKDRMWGSSANPGAIIKAMMSGGDATVAVATHTRLLSVLTKRKVGVGTTGVRTIGGTILKGQCRVRWSIAWSARPV